MTGIFNEEKSEKGLKVVYLFLESDPMLSHAPPELITQRLFVSSWSLSKVYTLALILIYGFCMTFQSQRGWLNLEFDTSPDC